MGGYSLDPVLGHRGVRLISHKRFSLLLDVSFKDSREGSGLSVIESSQGSHPFIDIRYRYLFLDAMLFQMSYTYMPAYTYMLAYTYIASIYLHRENIFRADAEPTRADSEPLMPSPADANLSERKIAEVQIILQNI